MRGRATATFQETHVPAIDLMKMPAKLDPRIFSTLATGMAAIVHPVLNTAVAGAIPSIIRSVETATPGADAGTRGCLQAALWLLADDLPTAHVLCQDVPTAFGSAWHAHLHRREGDFSNSRYWWRRAKGLKWHAPENLSLGDQIAALLQDAPRELAPWRDEVRKGYDPTKLVDLVEQHHMEGESAFVAILREIQRLEWATLFLECFRMGEVGR
jgi:hypothetical protein